MAKLHQKVKCNGIKLKAKLQKDNKGTLAVCSHHEHWRTQIEMHAKIYQRVRVYSTKRKEDITVHNFSKVSEAPRLSAIFSCNRLSHESSVHMPAQVHHHEYKIWSSIFNSCSRYIEQITSRSFSLWKLNFMIGVIYEFQTRKIDRYNSTESPARLPGKHPPSN